VTGSSAPGSFAILLPEGEHGIEFTGFPENYLLKSAVYGTEDLLRNPLRVTENSAEIVLRFESK
jgi:hypothetical protein